ncbi:hypothetical protein C5U48_02745 [Mycolicibacter virginiensis]|uniref:PIN domain-containing protein n=1 Tax=Mycolicibacter virginiensis TaxID=1795032 RepID=A0A9X7P073_9MYCO|nr:hypothetical protein C5U48_02745 [Mycolicibacter virginiensis]
MVLDLLIASDAAKADRAEYLLAGHGERHTILLPAIVIAEIAGAPIVRGNDLAKELREQRVAAALDWIRRSNFVVAELSERIARRASELAVEYQLRGPDASILATAEQWGCKHLYASDGDLTKCDGLLGFKITVPDDPPPPEQPEPHLFSDFA